MDGLLRWRVVLALRGTSGDGSERGNNAQPMRPLLPLRTAVTVSVTGRHCAAVKGTGTGRRGQYPTGNHDDGGEEARTIERGDHQ